MSAPSSTKRPKSPEPVAGQLFAAAALVPLSPGDHADDCRKLLCLIAAYADAGYAPSVRELAARLPGLKHDEFTYERLDKRLTELQRDGALEVRRAKGIRNAYALKVGAEASR